ncbi:MAG TPA: lytic transglycosylase domain-containing protein [Candidatus Angelobacter sp.]|nr:lytic transglycosylase domain-containing protein [Candidatus Angelobacter sp.]
MKPITIAGILLLAQLAASGAELAVLRNGYSIRFERKEQNGNVTRLYTDSGFIDVANDQIASFEAEEPPVPPQPVAAPQPAAAPASAASTTQPATALAKPAALNSVTPSARITNNVDLDQLVREASSRNRLDPDFVSSVIKAESDFKVRAVSKKGAQGLMQLMPGTAAQLGVTDPFDPRANVEAGTAHLSALLDQYHDDPIKALAAYNAGAHRVKQYNGVPPYAETRAYICRIVRDFNAKKRAQKKGVAAPNTKVAAKPASAPAKTVNSKPPGKSKPQQAGFAKPVNPA